MDFARETGVLTREGSKRLLEYFQGDEGRYRKMYVADIEEANGMTAEEAKEFKEFYSLFSGDENTVHKKFKFLVFDCISC